jgi:hypothetical protein
MHIAFERTGGVTGIGLRAELDTTTLPPDEAQEVDALIDRADFFGTDVGRARTPRTASPRADGFVYRVSVANGDRRRTIEVGEDEIPDALLPLIERLTAIARRERASRGERRSG